MGKVRNPRVWPDPTSVVAAHLIAADLTVYWAVPNPRPDEFVVVRTTGAFDRSRVLLKASVDVEVWSGQQGDSPRPAHLLAAQVAEHLWAAPGDANPITDVYVYPPVWLPDAESGCPRCLVRAEVTLKPSAPIPDPDPTPTQ